MSSSSSRERETLVTSIDIKLKSRVIMHYTKRRSASYIVREVREVREREKERDRRK